MIKILKSIWLFISSLVILGIAFIIAFSRSNIGLVIVIAILSITALVYAIKQLILYFSTARCMVGGMSILFKGIIALDFAIFLGSIPTMNLDEKLKTYVMIYLIVIYMATGAIDIFRAHEMHVLHNRSWKKKLLFGLVNIIIAVLCLVFFTNTDVMCCIYSLGLTITAVRRIAKIFRRTSMVYIQ